MLTIRQLEWIVWKAGQGCEQDGNLDMNLANLELRVIAERLLYLMKYPSARPMQEKYEMLINKASPLYNTRLT